MRMPKKKTFITLTVFLCLVFCPITALSQDTEFTQEELDYIKLNPVVVTAVDPGFVPFEFIDIDGNYKGIAADYLKLVEIKTGLSFEILEDITWSEAYSMALEGKVDLLPCVGVTRERQTNFILTESYLIYQRAIFSLSDGEVYRFKDMEDIAVGVQRNSSNYSYLAYETNVEPVLYDDVESLLRALSVGEIDAAVANYASAKYSANQLGITNIIAGELQDSATSELAMAVNEDNPMLASILNKALAQISEEDRIVIQNKWLGIEKEADYSRVYRYIIVIACVAVLAIAFFVFWNRLLKRNVEEKREAEQNLKLLLESVGEGIIGVDTQGKVNFINSKALELLKYKDSEILGKSIHQKIHYQNQAAQAYDAATCPICRTYTFGETHKGIDETFWRSDGSGFVVEYVSVPMSRENRIEGAVIVFQDITERIIHQKETRQALEKVKKLYASSLALTSTTNLSEVLGVIMTSLKEVVPFNTATIQDFKNGEFEIIHCEGFEHPEQVIGTKFSVENGKLNHKVLSTHAPIIVSDVRKYKDFLDLSEGKKIRSFMAVPLEINDEIIGELTLDGYEVGYYNEETAKMAEAFAAQAAIALNNASNFVELEKAKATAEQAAKIKGDFLANMSHEIRTPMNAVMGLLSLLQYTPLSPKQKDYVNKIDNASKNLLGIINDILDFSKIESGRLTIEKIEFNLDEVLSSLSDVLSIKTEDKGIEFVISRGDSVPNSLIGDPFRLEQVLLNLTSNAIKFTDQGEVVVGVRVEKKRKKQAILRFSVIDSGIGMTKEQVSRLFNAFVQADASTTRKYGGTGLGLSISKNLVELMGGKISVKSKLGKGSEFIFTCPFAIGDAHAAQKNRVLSNVEGLNVLVIEDNLYARDVVHRYLEQFGFNVTVASCGEEGFEEAKNAKYDLLIIDYKMPGINGVQTWEQIKASLGDDKLPQVIMISSYSRHELYEEAKRAGFDLVLAKPFTQSQLFDAIMSVFGEPTNDSKQQLKERLPEGFDQVRGARILVAEDNEINQQVIKELLEIQGFYVDFASNGKMVIQKIQEDQTYDLIFMDLQMPVMDGYAATRQLRRQFQMSVPIIALSADAMDGTKEAALAAGMDGYLTKPIDIEALFKILVHHIKPKKRKVNEKAHAISSISKEWLEKGLPELDVKNGLERFGDNTNLFYNTLIKFSENNKQFVKNLKDLLYEGETEEGKRLLHRLKGVSGNIGATLLNTKVKMLQQRLFYSVDKNDDFSEELCDIEKELSAIQMRVEILRKEAEQNQVHDDTVKVAENVLVLKLRKLQHLLEEYDTAAKFDYEELKHIDFGQLDEKFKVMGEHIENYAFDVAEEMCRELIDEMKGEDI